MSAGPYDPGASSQTWAGGAPPLLELTTWTSWRFTLALCAVLFAAGASVCTYGFFATGGSGALGGVLICGVLAALFGLLSAWCFLKRVRLYEWGFEARGIFSEIRLRFDEIDTVALPSATSPGADPMNRLTFRSPAGKVTFTGLDEARSREAANFAVGLIAPRIAEDTHRRLRSGDEVRFGALRLDATGVTFGRKRLAWAEIERANFSPEGLRVFPIGRPEGTIVLPTSTPNLHAFIELTSRVLDQLPPRATASTSAAALGAMGSTDAAPGSGRLQGFPDMDARLGNLVCGKGRSFYGTAFAGVLSAACAAVAILGGATGIGVEPRIVLLVIAAACAIGAFFLSRSGFAVYERGVRGVSRSLAFADAEHLWYHVVDMYTNGVYSGRTVNLTLEGSGSKVTFGGQGVVSEGIATAVIDRAMEPIFEKKWRELQEGRELRVGKLTITRDTLTWKGEALPLSQLQTHEARQGHLHLWRREKELSWAMVSLSERDARFLAPLLDRLLSSSPEPRGR